MSREPDQKPVRPAGESGTARRSAAPGKSNAAAKRHSQLGEALAKRGKGGDDATIHDAATVAVDNKGGGEAVDSGVAGRVGAHLGADFSGVRVHRDPLSGEATSAMGARAFAHGANVFLAPGESPTDLSLMAHELTHVAQQGAAGADAPQRQVQVGAANSPAEAEADAVADSVSRGDAPAGLIVEDNATQLAPGQMRKSEFLSQLKPAVISAANDELGPVWSAVGCPYIEKYFAQYQGKSAKHVSAVVKKYAPGAAAATTAASYIPIVVTKVRQATRTWVETGEITGTAREIAPPGVVGTAAAVHNEDGAQAKPDASQAGLSLREQLGDGAALRSPAASAIGDAYGEDFSGVRVHTGETAARMAADHDALAVTVGNDIAFAKGAYQPGTLEGDALLAHELAHVAQQSGSASPAATDGQIPDLQSDGLEHDADRAAAGALSRIYGGARKLASRVGPALKSGFGLSRCPSKSEPAKDAKKKAAKTSTGGTDFMADTHAPTDAEKKNVDAILDPVGSSGAGPKPFKEKYFRAHFKKAMLSWINASTKADKKLLGPDGFDLDMPQVRKTGQAAQEVVSARYGDYVKSATFDSGTPARKPGYDVGSPAVLHKQQDTIDTLPDKSDVDAIVRGLLDYGASQEGGGKEVILKSNWDSSRADDQKAYDDAMKSLFNNKKIYKQLVEIQRNWPGEEHPWDGTVYIQLRQMTDKDLAKKEKGGDAKFKDANLRKGYWGSFQTLIHEYLHACAHANLQTAADSGPGMSHQILIEGGCDYYTEKIWKDAESKIPGDAALREKVEGKKYPYNPDVIPEASYYAEKEDVKKIIAALGPGGEANFNAAYFLGHVEMIGMGKWKPGMSKNEGVYEAPIDDYPLSFAAERSNVDEATIAAENGLSVGDEVPKGTLLKVPGIKWHSCIPGDTKADIATQHAVKEAALEKANPYVNWSSLWEGKEILIPVRV